MTSRRKMKHTLQALLIGLITTIAALGVFSMIGCQAIEATATAVEWTAEQEAAARARFDQRVLDAQIAVDAGLMTHEELAIVMRESLLGFGAEMSTALVENAVTALEGKLSSATQGAGAAGGVIGLLSTLGSYYIRERSWRKKREPALVEKVKK